MQYTTLAPTNLDFGSIAHNGGDGTIQVGLYNPDPEITAHVYACNVATGFSSDFSETYIAPYQTAYFNIYLLDDTVGVFGGDLSFVIDDQPSLMGALTGTVSGIPAQLEVTPPEWDFGEIEMGGGNNEKVFTLSNSGELELTVTSVTITQRSDIFSDNIIETLVISGGLTAEITVTMLDDTSVVLDGIGDTSDHCGFLSISSDGGNQEVKLWGTVVDNSIPGNTYNEIAEGGITIGGNSFTQIVAGEPIPAQYMDCDVDGTKKKKTWKTITKKSVNPYVKQRRKSFTITNARMAATREPARVAAIVMCNRNCSKWV